MEGDLAAELVFSTYWGSGDAENRMVVFDDAGHVIMAGGGSSPDWPRTRERLGPGGHTDVTVAKFSPEGALVWSLVIGGPGEDYAYVGATDETGSLYLGGRAGPGFPVTRGAFDETFGGGVGGGPHLPTDGFVLKLSSAGELLWATYIGGSGDDIVRAIHRFPSGKLAVAGGNTASPDLPTRAGVSGGGVLKPRLGGAKDSFVAVIHPDGNAVDFLTYFGPDDDAGSGDETIRALGADSRGNLWIGGTTSGRDMRPTADAFQAVRGGGSSAFIAKLTPDGRQLVYFSWLGGSGHDEIETEGVSDAGGAFFVAGSSGSPDFPTTPGAFQPLLRGGDGEFGGDGIVAAIEDDGRLRFATLFGGSQPGPEALFGPAVDASGTVFATGRFRSRDAPTTTGAFQPEKAGGRDSQDAMLVAFAPDGRLRLATFFGGSGTDHGRHVAVHSQTNRVAIVGETDSLDLPLRNAAQAQPAGAFLAVFRIAPIRSAASAGHSPIG